MGAVELSRTADEGSGGWGGATHPARGIGAFYDRLRAAGKPFKAAITAVMRKLLVLANTLLREGRTWSPTPP